MLEYCLTHNSFETNVEFYIQTHGTAMGAHFAPSYVNLTMGYWEHLHIWQNNPYASHLVFYAHYIDDVVIIWDGPDTLIPGFLEHCNTNTMDLSFTVVSDDNKLAFLDLELFHHDNNICAQNYTKPTSGNSLLHYRSYHPRWVNNFPKSQFCWLRHNCARIQDYATHGLILKTKFKEKGYPDEIVEGSSSSTLSPYRCQERQNNENRGQYATRSFCQNIGLY